MEKHVYRGNISFIFTIDAYLIDSVNKVWKISHFLRYSLYKSDLPWLSSPLWCAHFFGDRLTMLKSKESLFNQARWINNIRYTHNRVLWTLSDLRLRVLFRSTRPWPNKWSLFSRIVSVRLSKKQKHATSLNGACWVTKFAKLVYSYGYSQIGGH